MNSISFRTNFGWISVFEENSKIVRIRFGKNQNKSISKNLKKTKLQIKNFLRKKIKTIHSNILIKGNEAQKKIWRELTKIKVGETITYGEIAKKYNMSPRFVGKICGQNKIVLAIPCHRVIRSDGKMGGFSGYGGIKLKKKLLDFEKNF